MAFIKNDELISQSIQIGFEARLKELVEDHIRKAKEDLELSMRREVPSIALSLMKHMSIERYGDDLRIIIKDMRT